MLTEAQLTNLDDIQRSTYMSLLESNNAEELASFEYFYGFTHSLAEDIKVTNQEVEHYQQAAARIKLKSVAQLINFIPHEGQQQVFFYFDERAEIYNNFVLVLGRRAQPLYSTIHMPSGLKTFADIQEGDEIYDPDGGTQYVQTVHDVYQGQVYTLSLNDGRSIHADLEHLFTLDDGQTLSLAELLACDHKSLRIKNPITYDRSAVRTDIPEGSTYIQSITYKGTEPVRCITVSSQSQCYVSDDAVRTHNTGKSAMTSVVALRELLLPFSSTILLTPTFNNAQIIFNNTLKLVQQLKLPIKKMNKGQFRFELETGARFSANSAANIESALGSSNSLLIVDETQSIPDLERIMNQMLVPTLLDFGTRPSGILWGHQIYLGTPRGTENVLYDLYIKEQSFPNWKSFNAPSFSNPTLPKTYFEQMRLELGEMLYQQEILAQFHGSDRNVFYAFNPDINLYDPATFFTSTYTFVVTGIDIGFADSTAQVWLYRTPTGSYYLHDAYIANNKSTKEHIEEFKRIDRNMQGIIDARYIDPAAAQAAYDFATIYDYETISANNAVKESIAYINLLLTPTGANNRPRLYINKNLTEVIRQISRVMYKETLSEKSKDPFIKDPKGTHWDIIAALRYALYSDMYNIAALNIFSSGR